MPILNYTTKIEPATTAGEIGALLASAGAAEISTRWADGRPAGMSFTLTGPHGPRLYVLPIEPDGIAEIIRRDKSPNLRPMHRTPEHAERVAWRVARDWIDAQLAIIEARMVTIEQVMLPYLVARDDGATLWQVYREREQAAIGGAS